MTRSKDPLNGFQPMSLEDLCSLGEQPAKVSAVGLEVAPKTRKELLALRDTLNQHLATIEALLASTPE